MTDPIRLRGSSTKPPKVVADFPTLTAELVAGYTGSPTDTVVTDVAARLRSNSLELQAGTGANTNWDFDLDFRSDGSSKLALQWYVPETGGPSSIIVYLSTTSNFAANTWANWTLQLSQGVASDDATTSVNGWNTNIIDLSNPSSVSGTFDPDANNNFIKMRIRVNGANNQCNLDRLIVLYDYKPRIVFMTDDGAENLVADLNGETFRASKNTRNIPFTHSIINEKLGDSGILTEAELLDLLSDGDHIVNHNIYSQSNIDDFAVDPANPTSAELANAIAEPLEGVTYFNNLAASNPSYRDQIDPYIFVFPEGVARRSIHEGLFKSNGFKYGRTIAGLLSEVANNVNFNGVTDPYFIRARGPAVISGTGTHTGTSGQTTVLTDSAKDFTALGQDLTGMTLTNTTDGCTGTITSYTATTITCSGGFSGGTDNDFDNGDAYTITGLQAAILKEYIDDTLAVYDGLIIIYFHNPIANGTAPSTNQDLELVEIEEVMDYARTLEQAGTVVLDYLDTALDDIENLQDSESLTSGIVKSMVR